MKTRLLNLWEAVRTSFWFIPGLMVLSAIGLSFAMVAVDRRAALEPSWTFALLYTGGPEGTRSILSTIAGSMITVAGVAFSITIVALTLTSSAVRSAPVEELHEGQGQSDRARNLHRHLHLLPARAPIGGHVGTACLRPLYLGVVRGSSRTGKRRGSHLFHPSHLHLDPRGSCDRGRLQRSPGSQSGSCSPRSTGTAGSNPGPGTRTVVRSIPSRPPGAATCRPSIAKACWRSPGKRTS